MRLLSKSLDHDACFYIGLLRWERQRSEWLSASRTERPEPSRLVSSMRAIVDFEQLSVAISRLARRARYIDVDEVIESIFSSPTGELPYSVTLPQMIDLLVDLWEADGLFD